MSSAPVIGRDVETVALFFERLTRPRPRGA
jgi:hypothetical protein